MSKVDRQKLLRRSEYIQRESQYEQVRCTSKHCRLERSGTSLAIDSMISIRQAKYRNPRSCNWTTRNHDPCPIREVGTSIYL